MHALSINETKPTLRNAFIADIFLLGGEKNQNMTRKSLLVLELSLNLFPLKDAYRRFRPAGIYLLKVNNRNTRTRCEICSKLTIKTPERR